MQIFIPYHTIHESVDCLDNKRLWKQVIECTQIINAIRGKYKRAWINHATTRMYWNYIEFVNLYRTTAWVHWRKRFSINASTEWHRTVGKGQPSFPLVSYTEDDIEIPFWWSDERIHDSHKAMLFRKDWSHYQQFRDYANLYEDYQYPLINAPVKIMDTIFSPLFKEKRLWYTGAYQSLESNCEYLSNEFGIRKASEYYQTVMELIG